MADFPSIEEFDAGQTTTNVNGNSNTNDMDFLAREKAALGGEADFFGSGAYPNHDGNQCLIAQTSLSTCHLHP